ncbi:toxin Cry1Ac domain D-VI-related protein, partial [Lactiplantibacillus plantarum]
MKKVVTGAAIVTSLFLMGGCSSSNSKSSQSSSSSVKISKSELSSKKSQKLEDATTDVDSLFSDSDHTALVPGTKKLLIDEVSKEVNKLTDSKGKSNLQKELKNAYVLYPKLASSVASSNAASNAKVRSESASESSVVLSVRESSSKRHLSSKRESSSSNADKYANKIMNLGVPTHATDVSYSNHTVT